MTRIIEKPFPARFVLPQSPRAQDPQRLIGNFLKADLVDLPSLQGPIASTVLVARPRQNFFGGGNGRHRRQRK